MNLHARLKSETASLHDQIEAQSPMKRLMSPDLTQAEYARALGLFWDIYDELEPALQNNQELLAALPDLNQRGKLDSLKNDLRALGHTVSSERAQSECSYARALGTMYVLEGSTLGGQVITKNLRRHAFIGDHNLQFFNHYGAETMNFWRAFLNVLAQANPSLDDEIVESAKNTFKRFAAAFAASPSPSTAAGVL